MKKTNFNRKPVYSVAMSQETGCIVMIEIVRVGSKLDGSPSESLKVIGALDREQSVKLAEEVTSWTASVPGAVKKAVKPKLHSVN